MVLKYVLRHRSANIRHLGIVGSLIIIGKHSDRLQSHMETQGDKHTQRLKDTHRVDTHSFMEWTNSHIHTARAKYPASEAHTTQSTDKLLPVILSSLVRQYSFLKEYRTRLSVLNIFAFEPL